MGIRPRLREIQLELENSGHCWLLAHSHRPSSVSSTSGSVWTEEGGESEIDTQTPQGMQNQAQEAETCVRARQKEIYQGKADEAHFCTVLHDYHNTALECSCE